jgi:hypothetical protein
MAVGLFYGHLEYFVAIWYILWLFGMFSPFWYDVHMYPEKSGNPGKIGILFRLFSDRCSDTNQLCTQDVFFLQ